MASKRKMDVHNMIVKASVLKMVMLQITRRMEERLMVLKRMGIYRKH